MGSWVERPIHARHLRASTADEAGRQRAACPSIPEGDVDRLVSEGRKEAMRLACEVRESDPRQVWGRLVLLGREDPGVLVAAMVVLAAGWDVDARESDVLGWVQNMTQAA